MIADRLPQGCLSPKKTAGIDGGPARWIVRCHDFTARGQTKEDAISEAWLKWESYLKRITGQTRAECEQREQALDGMREIAALMDGYDGEELMELMFGVRRIVELVIGGRRASAEGGD